MWCDAMADRMAQLRRNTVSWACPSLYPIVCVLLIFSETTAAAVESRPRSTRSRILGVLSHWAAPKTVKAK